MNNRFLSCVLCAGFLTLQPARGDLTITQKVEGMGQSTENTARFKDGKTRVDTSPGSSLIMDLKTGETISLNHPQKSYLKISADLTRAAADSVGQAQAEHPDERSPLTATGKKEAVGPYAAEEYTCTVAGVKVALWLTRDLPDYQAALREMAAGFKGGPLAGVMQNYGFDMSTLPGFPVRTVLELPSGGTMTRTVTAVTTAPLAAGDFQVPADYSEITARTLTPPAAAQGLPTVSPRPNPAP